MSQSTARSGRPTSARRSKATPSWNGPPSSTKSASSGSNGPRPGPLPPPPGTTSTKSKRFGTQVGPRNGFTQLFVGIVHQLNRGDSAAGGNLGQGVG